MIVFEGLPGEEKRKCFGARVGKVKMKVVQIIQYRYCSWWDPGNKAYPANSPASFCESMEMQDDRAETKADYIEAVLGLLVLGLHCPTLFKAWGTKELMKMHMHFGMMAARDAQEKGAIQTLSVGDQGTLTDEEGAMHEDVGADAGHADGRYKVKWSELRDSEVVNAEQVIEQEETAPRSLTAQQKDGKENTEATVDGNGSEVDYGGGRPMRSRDRLET